MLDADDIILGSPIYFADVSTELKTSIDRVDGVFIGWQRSTKTCYSAK